MMHRLSTPACAALFWLALSGCFANRGEAAPQPPAGTNTRAVRDAATRAMPLAKVNAQLAPQIRRVVSNPSIFRRLPVQVVDCDPRMYHFLLNNPEVIVNIWQVMGITKVQMTRTGPTTYEASDGAGASGTLHVAYSDHETQVIYCEGIYNGPMFPKPIQAQCVLLITAGYVQETNRRYFVTSRCDAFIHLDHAGLELLARTFQPMVNKSADINFIETANFVSMVSRTSEVKPTGMARLGGKLQNVSPDVRERFIALTQQVAVRARQNQTVLAESAAKAPQRQVRGQR